MWVDLSAGVGCLRATIVSRAAGVNAARTRRGPDVAGAAASRVRFVDTRISAS
jgi:hypothetical protein